MEGAITSFAVEKVKELIGNKVIEDATLFFGVDGQLQQLRTELTRIQGFLQKFDSRRGEGPNVNNYIVEIRRVAYDAEDIIETYILKVESRRGGGPNTDQFHCLKFLERCASIFCEAYTRYNIAMDIKSLNNTITDITESAKKYDINLTRDEEVSSSNYDGKIELMRTYGHVKEEGVVGLDKHVEELSGLLMDGVNHIAILGMGGLGKTTLAKKLYHDGLVRNHFQFFAWICISQKWEIKDVIRTLLIAFESTSVSSGEINEELLPKLYKLQEEKKCLIVLDDVWSVKDWESMSAAFPKKTSSKIVLTTRNIKVAQRFRVHMDGQVYIHQPQTLGDDESKQLFWKKALLTNSIGLYRELKEETEREVLNHCGGLPLAIVVLGGLLSQMETHEDWRKVLDDIPYHFSKGGVMEVLAFSYWNLPYHLKPCFSYLGQYQEDAKINVESLVRKWVAEGIVSSEHTEGIVSSRHRGKKTLVEVARGYLLELAGRCMVQTGVTRRTGRIKYFRLHDVVREFCLTKLDEQKDFLKIIDFRARDEPALNTTSKVRRLAIYMDGPSNINKDGYIKDCISNPHLRSLSYSITEKGQPILLEGLKMLRTLNIEGAGFVCLPKVVGRLFHLRYLSIRKSKISKIPSSIGNLRFLQTLDLRVQRMSYGNMIIPNVLWKMEQLTHLYLPDEMKSGDCPKLRLDTLGKLETLINFDTEHVDVNCLSKLGNLQKLTAEFNDIEDVSVILGSPSVVNNQLQHSNLSIKWDTIIEETQAQVLCQLLRCHHLHKLELNCRLLKLPISHEFLHSLVYLVLGGTHLEEDPMPTLEKLPQLRYLIIGLSSFVGNEMVCSCASESGSTTKDVDCGFPRLVELRLKGLKYLEDWKVEKGAMPNLQYLFIDGCNKLKQVPEGLQYITTLMKLEVCDMDEEFTDMFKEGGRDYYKVQHIPQVEIYKVLLCYVFMNIDSITET